MKSAITVKHVNNFDIKREYVYIVSSYIFLCLYSIEERCFVMDKANEMDSQENRIGRFVGSGDLCLEIWISRESLGCVFGKQLGTIAL